MYSTSYSTLQKMRDPTAYNEEDYESLKRKYEEDIESLKRKHEEDIKNLTFNYEEKTRVVNESREILIQNLIQEVLEKYSKEITIPLEEKYKEREIALQKEYEEKLNKELLGLQILCENRLDIINLNHERIEDLEKENKELEKQNHLASIHVEKIKSDYDFIKKEFTDFKQKYEKLLNRDEEVVEFYEEDELIKDLQTKEKLISELKKKLKEKDTTIILLAKELSTINENIY